MSNDTQKMMLKAEAPYAEFGSLLSGLRQKAGIAQQSQLADSLNDPSRR